MATDMQTQTVYSCGHSDKKPDADWFIKAFTNEPCPQCKKRGVKSKRSIAVVLR